MADFLQHLIRQWAEGRCEYCRLPEFHGTLRHVLDHVVAKSHDGGTVASNLALCCGRYNRFKGTNLTGIDPLTGSLTRLFHPRLDRWNEHFVYVGPVLKGLTDVGRTTAAVLRINLGERVEQRSALIVDGQF